MKKLTILIYLVFISIPLSAQPTGRKEMKEKIKTMKIAFITEKLDLSSSEAEKFWPIYNAFDKAYMELRHEKLRAIKNELKDQIDTITDEVALIKLNELLAAEAELNALKQTFHVKLKNVISSKKILLLKISEEGFNRQMMKRLRNRHKDQKH